MKRISGPWLSTALAPTKCSPGTLDSQPAASTGEPPRQAILAEQLRRQHAELGDVDAIAGAEQNMIVAAHAVIELDRDTARLPGTRA